MVGASPFSEEVLEYSVAEFPFERHVRLAFFGEEGASRAPPLDQLHLMSETKQRSRRSQVMARPSMVTGLIDHPGFVETYHKFIRDVVRPHLEEDYVVFEHSPNLRVHAAGGRSITGPHRDLDHQHSPYEVNFWLPLVQTRASASMWAESAPGKGDFHPFEVDYGQVMRFYGNQCMHYTLDNETDTTRVSLDFRVVRFRDFWCSGIPRPGQEAGERWAMYSYYDVMGPNGPVLKGAWDALASLLQVPENASQSSFSGPLGNMQRDLGASRRERSSSCEHQQRCVKEHGDRRTARKKCPRCGWIANRCKLSLELVYTTAEGEKTPWVAENPDMSHPWGLGCLVCHDARRNGLLNHIPDMGFSDFSFGANTPGLLVGPLVRHGNHGLRQLGSNYKDAFIAVDDAHAVAVGALSGKPESASRRCMPPVRGAVELQQ
mmetsp:Transcript_138110/g.440485  ORF Transcript_138110/g.440485 Transcript_138110/m.440485 type:complete len:433 (+) Transcript_138110:59-1357(+)